MPKRADELGITCGECGQPAEWFDYGRARKDHRAGFVCDSHPALGRREKLLTASSAGVESAGGAPPGSRREVDHFTLPPTALASRGPLRLGRRCGMDARRREE